MSSFESYVTTKGKVDLKLFIRQKLTTEEGVTYELFRTIGADEKVSKLDLLDLFIIKSKHDYLVGEMSIQGDELRMAAVINSIVADDANEFEYTIETIKEPVFSYRENAALLNLLLA